MKKFPSHVIPPLLVTLLALIAAWSIASLPAAIAAPAAGSLDAPVGVGAAISTTISGIVTLPDGSLPLPYGTMVWLYRPSPEPDADVRSSSSVVTSTGEYSFAGIEPGVYVLRAKPPDLPPFAYAPSYRTRVTVLNSPVNVPLQLTYPSVTGTVFAPDGVTPDHAIVHVFSTMAVDPFEVEVRGTRNGNFTLGGIPTGTYQLAAEPWPTDHTDWWSQRVTVHITPTNAPASAQFVSLTLQSPQVFGVVQSPYHTPVFEARVIAVSADGKQRSELTDPQGRFAIDSLQGSTATVSVEEPLGFGWMIEPAPQVVNLPNATPMTFTLSLPNKTLNGHVQTAPPGSQPVSSALVEAHRVDRPGSNESTTDASGAYSMSLAPGLWKVKVSPISTTVPHDWFFPFEARLVEFSRTPTAEVKTLNFDVVVADANVSGYVLLPDHSAPPFPVTVLLHSDEGIGAEQQLDGSGHFSINIPHGVYRMDLQVDSPLFAAPPLKPVVAHVSPPTVLPTITLLPRNTIIKGSLTDGSSNPVENIPVIAWNPETHATFHTRSGDDGVYAVAVYSDTWIVRPAPGPEQPYVFTGSPADVTILTGQIIGDVDFTLTATDATLHGNLVDDNGQRVMSAHGWANATDGSLVRTGAPIRDGQFDILVPHGTYTVGIHMPDDQRYMADGHAQSVAVAPGSTTTLTFKLDKKTALLWGALLNKRTGTNPVGLDGWVWAWDDGLFAHTDIANSGLFYLPVAPGLWRVNYAIDPDSGWVKTAGPRSYGLQKGESQFVPLPVVRKDAVLSGTVVLADGTTPAQDVTVIADGLSPDISGVTFRAAVRDNGTFAMKLPSGLYHVRATPLPGLINPALKTVSVPHNGTAGVTLRYRQPDAMLTGAVSGSFPITAPVHISAWSADDGYSIARAPNGGTYTLPVISGQTWNLRAIAETRSSYWFTRTAVRVTTPGTTVQNLALVGPRTKPAPVSVMFDASQDELIELSDGTRIFIPGGALPATGSVILHVTPLAAVPSHRLGDVFGLTYAFEAFTSNGQPITQNFNQDVAISFRYDPTDLMQRGLNLDRIRPAYFSTTTDRWTAPDSFVVDEDRHVITMEIDHFTTMGLVDAPADIANQLYLPLTVR